mmetsp:Transcript_24909/g.51499  ORF Transcript_24909/g.51499 Transcript_24909/m.51499 type:complete len:597 (-) Transcript_24909:90-1880(-)
MRRVHLLGRASKLDHALLSVVRVVDLDRSAGLVTDALNLGAATSDDVANLVVGHRELHNRLLRRRRASATHATRRRVGEAAARVRAARRARVGVGSVRAGASRGRTAGVLAEAGRDLLESAEHAVLPAAHLEDRVLGLGARRHLSRVREELDEGAGALAKRRHDRAALAHQATSRAALDEDARDRRAGRLGLLAGLGGADGDELANDLHERVLRRAEGRTVVRAADADNVLQVLVRWHARRLACRGNELDGGVGRLAKLADGGAAAADQVTGLPARDEQPVHDLYAGGAATDARHASERRDSRRGARGHHGAREALRLRLLLETGRWRRGAKAAKDASERLEDLRRLGRVHPHHLVHDTRAARHLVAALDVDLGAAEHTHAVDDGTTLAHQAADLPLRDEQLGVELRRALLHQQLVHADHGERGGREVQAHRAGHLAARLGLGLGQARRGALGERVDGGVDRILHAPHEDGRLIHAIDLVEDLDLGARAGPEGRHRGAARADDVAGARVGSDHAERHLHLAVTGVGARLSGGSSDRARGRGRGGEGGHAHASHHAGGKGLQRRGIAKGLTAFNRGGSSLVRHGGRLFTLDLSTLLV